MNTLSGLAEAIAKVGSGAKLADLIGVSRQAIYQWQVIPADRVVAIELATGVPRERLRPDLYRPSSETAA